MARNVKDSPVKPANSVSSAAGHGLSFAATSKPFGFNQETENGTKGDKKWKLYASLSYVVFIVVVGLPLWWQTTTVYRVGLPRTAITALATTPVTIKYLVNIVCVEVVEPEMSLVVDGLRHRSGFILNDRVQLDVAYSLFVSADLDDLTQFVEDSKSVADFDRLWSNNPNRSMTVSSSDGDDNDDSSASMIPGEGGLEIVIIPEKWWIKLFGTRRSAHFGSYRTFYVRQFSREILGNWLDHLVFDAYVDVSGLMSVSQDALKESGNSTTANDESAANHKQNRLAIPHPRYNVDVYLLNPVPDKRDVRFDLTRFMDQFGEPLTSPLRLVSNFSVQVQKLYDPALSSKLMQSTYPDPIPVTPPPSSDNKETKSADASANGAGTKDGADDGATKKQDSPTASEPTPPPDRFHLSHTSFPSLMTDIEQKVGTIKEESVLNLFLYFPPFERSPLILVDSREREILYNTYVIEGWGSFSVYNGAIPNPEESSGGKGVGNRSKGSGGLIVDELDPKYVYRVLASVLKGVIAPGLRFPHEITKSNTPFALWEVQRISRSTLCHRYLQSVKTLESLLKLLDGITNIVINDEVGLAIETSMSHLQSAMSHLEAGRSDAALIESNLALVHSQRAFFDPTLLALLYFPEDQKYAIYIPLFLPVGVPIVLSLLGILKMLKGKRVKESKD